MLKGELEALSRQLHEGRENILRPAAEEMSNIEREKQEAIQKLRVQAEIELESNTKGI